jgi:hypothetical protein
MVRANRATRPRRPARSTTIATAGRLIQLSLSTYFASVAPLLLSRHAHPVWLTGLIVLAGTTRCPSDENDDSRIRPPAS